MPKHKTSKPFSEMSPTEQRREAKAAIERLERTMSTSDNHVGSYGKMIREAIQRWRDTLARLDSKGGSGAQG